MKFEPVTKEEAKRLRCRKKKVMAMVEEFWESDHQAVRVCFDETEYKNISSAQDSFSKAAKRLQVGVFVMQRNGQLYLMKEEIKKEVL